MQRLSLQSFAPAWCARFDIQDIRTIPLSGTLSGTFRLGFQDSVTSLLSYDATAAQVELALESLGAYAGAVTGDVQVFRR
jgi:hypothetical protein